MKRKLIKIDTPEGQPGFLGPGHIARPVVSGPFSSTDPFILLMDDMLDKKDNEPVGGAHPHAGFEIASFLLEGEMGDEAHKMKGGDFQIMTAGTGIVHTETMEKKTKMRLLQLWLNVAKKDKWTDPRVQNLPLEHAPVVDENGVHLKLYSGSLSGVTSPIENYTQLIVADITIDAGVSTIQQLPANFNTFLYVIKGSVKVGEDVKQLNQHQVGWLNLSDETAEIELKLTAGEAGVRFVLYAGKPNGESIVSRGPFIADSQDEIQRLYQEYRQRKMKHISTLPENQKIFL